MKEFYYDIAPATRSYRGLESLTYSSSKQLKIGQVVKITLRSRSTLGVVVSSTSKPSFGVSSIEEFGPLVVLPKKSMQLWDWMRSYYPGSLGQLTQFFAPSLLASTTEPSAKKTSKHGSKVNNLPALTKEQSKVIDEIGQPKNSQTFLLHGETGSGKTRVYIELAKQCQKRGESALILTPEISLTAPLKKQFDEVFGEENVLSLHSNLTAKERRNVWARIIFNREPSVVIGPRSALFAPLPKLGLIVVDESHDQAYKEESNPYYYGLRVASKLAQLSNAVLIFGSATPLINEYFLASQKETPVLRMVKPAKQVTHKPQPPIIIDMTDKSQQRRGALSQALIDQIKLALKQKRQVLLFLNRRGSARSILCHKCGWRSFCDNCDNGLIYHQDRHQLLCHTCGYRTKPPSTCPECGSSDILFKSPGTKAVQDDLVKLFPGHVVARFDKDNLVGERMEQKYDQIASGKIDILVGTQILTKGHDLPHLGLAAMLSADSSLEFPDYTSEERSYQLISQLKGRINRGHNPGQLVIQTYQPDSALIKQALSGEWHDFYSAQLAHRQQLNFPPFVHALKIEASKSTQAAAKTSINKVAEDLSGDSSLALIGPSPSYVEKRANKYRWQLIVTSKDRGKLTKVAEGISGSHKAELDPLHFL